MKRKTESKHIVDVLFVLAMFCLFAIYAVLLIVVGAKVYQKTINGMNDNFNSRTPFSYVTEKIRQSDRMGALEIGKIGEYDALIINETLQDKEYCTYIYAQDGWLKELLTEKNNSLSPDAGQNIIQVTDFHISQTDDGIFNITLIDSNKQTLHFSIGIKSAQQQL